MLRVEVLESYRDEVTRNAKTKLIAYLGSIRQEDLGEPLEQEKFWRKAEVRLGKLSLPSESEEEVKRKVLEKIPRPASISDVIASLSRRWPALLRVR